MHRFVNPERWVCPKEGTHVTVRAKQRQQAGRERGGQTVKRRSMIERMLFGEKKRRKKPKTVEPGSSLKSQRMTEWNKKNPQPRDPKTGKFLKKKKNGK